MNVVGNPDGQERLRAHGFTGVPIVCADDRCVPGGDLKAIADLVGFAYQPPEMLSPEQLYRSWSHILESACRYIRQIPEHGLAMTPPDRDRSLLDLCFHVLHIGRTFLKAYDEGVRESWSGLTEPAPETVRTTAALAEYGEETRTQLSEWWERAGQHDPMDRVLESYWGAHTLHEVLERETWHTTHHTRQVLLFLGMLNVTPDRPLTAADLAGLPLPERVWD